MLIKIFFESILMQYAIPYPYDIVYHFLNFDRFILINDFIFGEKNR